MTVEEKAAQEKLEQDKKNALELELAKKEKSRVKIEDGMVQLSEQDYTNLVGKANDMDTYKEDKKKLAAELEAKIAAELKLKEDKLVEDGKLKELNELKDKKNVELQAKLNDQEINSALQVASLKAGIKKSEYIKLFDKSKIKRDETTNEIIGVDELIETFKKENPDLFKSAEEIHIDTTKGGSKSGVMSDEELRALNGADRMKIKATDPVLHARIMALSKQGRVVK